MTRSDTMPTIQIGDERFVVGEQTFLDAIGEPINFTVIKRPGRQNVREVYKTVLDNTFVCALEGYESVILDLVKI